MDARENEVTDELRLGRGLGGREGQRAFTLIELLVVISIIVLLISILMPALAGARKKTEEVTCAINVRNLLVDLNIYLTEYDQVFPLNGVVLPKPGGVNTAPTVGYGAGEPDMQRWDLPYGQLWKYANNQRKKFICPMDVMARTDTRALLRDEKNATTPIGLTPALGKGYWSYSVNSVCNSEGRFRENFLPRGASASPAATSEQPWADPLRTIVINRPVEFIVFIEEDSGSMFNDEVFDAPAYNGGDKLTGRHHNGGNVGFLNGNVEWYSDVLFNTVPTAMVYGSMDHWNAMQSPYTRMFFPDSGNFATPP